MKSLILAALLASTAPALAGGPVMVEDATEEAAAARDRDNTLLFVLLGAAVAIAVLNGGDCTCHQPDPETPGSCGC